MEKVFVSFFYYLGYRRFVSRVQVLPTAATQKTFQALPVRCSGETPPGARGIRKFCDNHCTVDQLQLGITHPATSTSKFSLLLPFHWPPYTWPWMTLNGHFTLYYELTIRLWIICYLFTVDFLNIDECLWLAGSGVQDCEWLAEYLESTGKVHYFLDATSSKP